MNLLLSYFFYFYVFCSKSAYTRQAIRIGTKTGFIEIIPTNETHATTTTTRTTFEPIQKLDAKEIESLLLKMLTIATNADKMYTTNKAEVTTTERIKTTALGVKTIIGNRPEKYDGTNETINQLCPYFMSDDSFNMEKMPGVYWPRFYNMNETLKCFKIEVVKLTENQMKANANKFGTFGDKINWQESHFEIKPPKTISKRRHFLVGGPDDMGVMRNIMITKNENDDFILQEESPDQWLMLKELVLLRDCMTGEVVVFTKSPQSTSTVDVVGVLQDLDEEMTGQMVCDEDDDWLRDYYV